MHCIIGLAFEVYIAQYVVLIAVQVLSVQTHLSDLWNRWAKQISSQDK